MHGAHAHHLIRDQLPLNRRLIPEVKLVAFRQICLGLQRLPEPVTCIVTGSVLHGTDAVTQGLPAVI